MQGLFFGGGGGGGPAHGGAAAVPEVHPLIDRFVGVMDGVQVEDHFAPLPEFEIHFLYDDFSTPCFDGWHTGIMGGSWISSGDLASNYARYHFRRHFFQHLGFRWVPAGAVHWGARGGRPATGCCADSMKLLWMALGSNWFSCGRRRTVCVC
jgi:hypothetical protein